jgi:acetyl esterase/lipase
MKKEIAIELNEQRIRLAANVVYGQRKYWGGQVYRNLSLSLMYPEYVRGKKEVLPLIIWFCGGAFTEVDGNIWLPELVWFAKQGFIVASVEYSVTPVTVFPEQIEDAKLAIRFLKAHSNEYHIDPNKVVVMGESAGGYITSICGVTGKSREYDKGGYENYSSEIQAAVPWYAPAKMSSMSREHKGFIDVVPLITKDTPPFLILHGNKDNLVPLEQSEILYDGLQKAGIDSDFIVVNDATHGDPLFCQDEVRKIIITFIKDKLKKL